MPDRLRNAAFGSGPVLPGWVRRAPLLAGLLVLLALGTAGWNWRLAGAEAERVAAARSFVLSAEGLLSALRDIETGQRGYLLTGDESFLDPQRAGTAAVPARLREMREAARGAGLPEPSGVEGIAARKVAWTEEVIAQRRRGETRETLALFETGEGKVFMDAARGEVARLQQQASSFANGIEARSRHRSAWLYALSLGLALAAAGLLGILALLRRRTERRANALLHGVMENAPIGLGFLDRQLRLSLANRHLALLGERALGVEAGRGDVLPDSVRAQIAPQLQKVLEGADAQSGIEVTVRPPGKDRILRHLTLGVFPLELDGTEDGVDGVGLVAVDETGRRRAEARLKRSEARLRTILDAIPQLAWMTDPDGAIQWYNRRWYDFTGAPPGEMLGDGWQSVQHPDHRARVVERFREAIEAGEPWEDTFPLRGADGRYRWFLSRALPLFEAGDEEEEARPIGWFGTNTDIAELREAEEQLAAAKAAAEDANIAKSQFIANMSHELRTPLSAVIGYAEMLEEEAQSLEKADVFLDDLGKITANARHLLSLINDVLDLSKIEAGKMEVQPEDFEVAPLLREVASTVEALAERRRNRLVVECADDLGSAHSDPVKIRQCLFNLLGNAAKFTEDGTITLHAERDGDRLRFTVRDTGIGMSPEQLDKLFQRFSQADASTTRRFGGTGLGLAITRAFTTMLGGDIAVESKAGEGSAFTLTIPADMRLVRAEADEPAAQIGEAVAAEQDGPAGLVLVIDDDAATRDLLSRFLRREGFAVRCAPDGAQGLEMARQLRPVAILLDVMMPRMDGWAVLSALKADAALAGTPVVMVTVVQERGLAFSLGADDYLNKPVRWDRLKRVLDRFRREVAPGHVLLLESDEAERRELAGVLAAEGWTVATSADAQDAMARLASPPVPAVLVMELRAPAAGEGFALLRELRRRPELRETAVIAITEGEVDEAELDRLRAAVDTVVPAEAASHALAEELRRVVAGTPRSAPETGAPEMETRM
ncbi:response regulator [Falsiroseomonas oryziterrae]|uniref:response regulator n=1 Tax=Falsiroseomonas oryziterrae TaxID=2911368 RepID=UPI001F173F10|nr:response regulator [Roseomonas sp. NPKOSM-4]